ncbi:MAG: class I SAM-dependent methyltransferase [Alphaproteobacteria bacterium]|nr:class I SAM-dependent methyltransferase [Alphaproteobacteria bacterium]MBO6629077.1 class I SAM-dependent methyltransferase [Alphaproteobacteria bacterium]MDF1624920.1 cyclopropane-fatty-acyl-phospholipid synthase [Parvibaculaceae bacterium]
MIETDSHILRQVPFHARAVLKAAGNLARGQLTVTLPNGETLIFTGAAAGKEAEITIIDYHFAWSIILNGHLGAAESFLRGDWESPDVERVLELFAENREVFTSVMNGLSFQRLTERIAHGFRKNNRAGSKKNIHFHYDLGNSFYKRWLDPTMTYSSARFDSPHQDLSAAQMNKYRSLAHNMDLKPDSNLLEIGCGWGGFAEYAASEIGCKVTALTISNEQLAFARERIASKGLSDRVEVRFQDYRDVTEKFDRIASIEMFEAVGEQYWPAYFSKVRDCLTPGGLAGLQIITIDDRSFESYRKGVDFIQRYVFPGGMLPSPSALKRQVSQAGLSWKTNVEFGLDYAETLARWRDRFQSAWPEIREMGFDERFRRLWDFYLAYCEAGFRTGNVDVTQLTLSRP